MDTHIINIKTFEEFQDDNKKYYPQVIEYFKDILTNLTSKTEAGDWKIESNSDLFAIAADDKTDAEIWFKNEELEKDIYVRYSSQTSRIEDPGDDVTAPLTESNMKIIIEEVIYYQYNGTDENDIVVTPELEKLSIEILHKISHIKINENVDNEQPIKSQSELDFERLAKETKENAYGNGTKNYTELKLQYPKLYSILKPYLDQLLIQIYQTYSKEIRIDATSLDIYNRVTHQGNKLIRKLSLKLGCDYRNMNNGDSFIIARLNAYK